MGNVNFDKELRFKKGAVQYRMDKAKAGRSGSSAGRPRPYARQNMAKARLYSPSMVGRNLTVTPKHPYLAFRPGIIYEWGIMEEGVGEIDGIEITADEISEHFIVKRKG